MKEIRQQTDGETYHVLGLVESILWSDYTTQSNLQIQYNPYQITNAICHRTRTKKKKRKKEKL